VKRIWTRKERFCGKVDGVIRNTLQVLHCCPLPLTSALLLALPALLQPTFSLATVLFVHPEGRLYSLLWNVVTQAYYNRPLYATVRHFVIFSQLVCLVYRAFWNPYFGSQWKCSHKQWTGNNVKLLNRSVKVRVFPARRISCGQDVYEWGFIICMEWCGSVLRADKLLTAYWYPIRNMREFVTVLKMRIIVFWGVTACWLVISCLSFGGAMRLHLHGSPRHYSRTTPKAESTSLSGTPANNCKSKSLHIPKITFIFIKNVVNISNHVIYNTILNLLHTKEWTIIL